MVPRPDVSAERKQQILQAAHACFAQKGYYLTTMDDIVAESGLSKGALYWYYEGKKELFLALFEYMTQGIEQTWKAIVNDEKASAREKLLASMSLFRTELESMVPTFGIVLEAWALVRHDKEMEELIGEYYQPYLELMDRILQEGIENGEFEFASKDTMALVIMTVFDGITLALGSGLWKADWNKVMDAAEELVLNGVGVTRA